jgi:hypothetical protein
LQHGAGDDVIAAEEGVNVAHQFQHAGFGQGAALADDFVAFGGEQIVE